MAAIPGYKPLKFCRIFISSQPKALYAKIRNVSDITEFHGMMHFTSTTGQELLIPKDKVEHILIEDEKGEFE